MAIFHASTKTVTRSSGRSAVAAAAYRSGSELTDARTGLVHDYTRKGGVISAEIIAPHGLILDREAHWSAVELAEKRSDSRTAREWIIALPEELSADDRNKCAVTFATHLMEKYGVAVDLAIHAPSGGDDRNHHAHLLMNTRVINPDGTFGAKALCEIADKELRKRTEIAERATGSEQIKAIRGAWESIANRALEAAGLEVRIDARSHKDRELDEVPTKHLGPVATDMERNGEPTVNGDYNRQAAAINTELALAKAEIIDLNAYREKRILEDKAEALAAIKAAEQAAAELAGLVAERAKAVELAEAAAAIKASNELDAKRQQQAAEKRQQEQKSAWDKLPIAVRINSLKLEMNTLNKSIGYHSSSRPDLIEDVAVARVRVAIAQENAKAEADYAAIMKWAKDHPFKAFFGMTKEVDALRESMEKSEAKAESLAPSLIEAEAKQVEAVRLYKASIERGKQSDRERLAQLSDQLKTLENTVKMAASDGLTRQPVRETIKDKSRDDDNDLGRS